VASQTQGTASIAFCEKVAVAVIMRIMTGCTLNTPHVIQLYLTGELRRMNQIFTLAADSPAIVK
jgi:hypothetical protein